MKRKSIMALLMPFMTTVASYAQVEINNQTFPDPNFRAYLQEQSYGEDNILTEEEIANIKSLFISYKGIKDLTGIKVFTSLEKLECQYNELTTLDVSGCKSIQSLICHSNILTALNVEGCDALAGLKCSYNNLTSLDLTGLTSLETLYFEYNNLTQLELKDLSKLRIASGTDNCLTQLSISGCPNLVGLNFNNNKLTALKLKDLQNFTTLWIENNQLTTLDISNCPALATLRGAYNQLTSFDVTGCQNLTTLDLGDNNLQGINISSLTKVKSLYIEYNSNLQELNVSENKALRLLNCQSCGLTSLSLSNNTELTTLNCASNQLTELDLSANTKLNTVEIYKNLFDSEHMGIFITKLPEVNKGTLNVLASLKDNNVMTAEQAADAKAKGWTAKYHNTFTEGWQEYCGLPEGLLIDETTFPDQAFRNHILKLEIGGDWVLTEEEINSLNSLSLENQNIESLKGIEVFPNLNFLNCSRNQLTELDVTKNTHLRNLYCYENLIESLNLSDLKELEEINCECNMITSLNLQGCTKLKTLYCNNNDLTELDLTNCVNVETLNCSSNEIQELNLDNCTKINRLFCQDNELQELDVTKCKSITILFCNNNQLTNVDVNGCNKLQAIKAYKNKMDETGMNSFVQSLPMVNDGLLLMVNNTKDNNIMTETAVNQATDKGWTCCYLDGVWKNYIGATPVVVKEIIKDKTSNTRSFSSSIYDLNGNPIKTISKSGIYIWHGIKKNIKK